MSLIGTAMCGWNHLCGHTPVLLEKHGFILIVWDSKLDRVGQLLQMSTYSKGLKPLLREQNNEWEGKQQSIYCAKKTLAVYQNAANGTQLPPNLHGSLFRCKEKENSVRPIYPLESEFAWINKAFCSKKAVYLPWTVKALTFSQLGRFWRTSAIVRTFQEWFVEPSRKLCHSEQTWNSIWIVRHSWPNSAALVLVFMSAESG